MSRYETFVIRVWVDDEAILDHGEIRHLGSGMGLRFLKIPEVIRFIERVAPGVEAGPMHSRKAQRAKG
ncbi:MAG: hypothetical protein ABIU97_00310 [Dehalococcoidia bacterium]